MIDTTKKPHIYFTFYPTLNHGFFRVTRKPKNKGDVRLWAKAHCYIDFMNQHRLTKQGTNTND